MVGLMVQRVNTGCVTAPHNSSLHHFVLLEDMLTAHHLILYTRQI